MFNFFKNNSLSLLVLSLLVLPKISLADGATFSIDNPLSVDTLEQFIEIILGAIVQVGGIVLVFGIIYTGFLFVKARGNASELTTAKESFVWTVIGAAIILGAFVILRIVQATIAQLL